MLCHFFWDPSPILFQFSFITIYWYSLCFALGFLSATAIAYKLLIPQSMDERQFDRLVWYLFIGLLLGARLGHVLFYDLPYYLDNPEEILMIWKGGLASHGSVIGLGLALYFFSKRYQKPLLPLVDTIALVAPLAGGFIRIGNFFNQEITGNPTSAPWGIIFGHPMERIRQAPVHPVQLYEALLYFVLFGIGYFWLRPLAHKPGRIVGIMLTAIFTGRFILEWFKAPQSAFDLCGLSTGQILSIPFILMGIYFTFRKLK